MLLSNKNEMILIEKSIKVILRSDGELRCVSRIVDEQGRRRVDIDYYLNKGYSEITTALTPSPYGMLKQASKFDAFTGQSYATLLSYACKIVKTRGDRLLIEFTRKHGGKNKIRLWCSRINFIFTPSVKLVGLSELKKLKGYETTMM